MTIADFLTGIEEWAEREEEIIGVLLVGSHARGEARADSDVDLVLLARTPERFIEDISVIERFGQVIRREKEDWGRVTSVRVWYAEGLEVEFGWTDPGWAALPPDSGTWQVVSDGARIVYDRGGALATLLAAVRPGG